MSFMDKIRDTVVDNADKADGVIDKVAELVDGRTGGKHHDKIIDAAEKAKGAAAKLDRSSKE